MKEERGKWGIFEGAVVNKRRGEAPRPTMHSLGKGAERTGLRIATASVRTGLAMTGFPWSVVHGRRATARVAPTEGYK